MKWTKKPNDLGARQAELLVQNPTSVNIDIHVTSQFVQRAGTSDSWSDVRITSSKTVATAVSELVIKQPQNSPRKSVFGKCMRDNCGWEIVDSAKIKRTNNDALDFESLQNRKITMKISRGWGPSSAPRIYNQYIPFLKTNPSVLKQIRSAKIKWAQLVCAFWATDCALISNLSVILMKRDLFLAADKIHKTRSNAVRDELPNKNKKILHCMCKFQLENTLRHIPMQKEFAKVDVNLPYDQYLNFYLLIRLFP